MAPNRRLPDDDAWRILAASQWGVLSCIDEDGLPYATPVNAVLDPQDRCLYFHCRRIGRRMRALTANPRVCYVAPVDVSLPEMRFITWYECAMVEGVAERVADDDLVRDRLRLICDRLAPGQLERREDDVIERYLPAVAIMRIVPERVSAKRNRDD